MTDTDTTTTPEVEARVLDFRTRISAAGHPSQAVVLPVTQGHQQTFDIAAATAANCYPEATMIVSAQRIGFHVSPARGAKARADYITIAPVSDFGPVVLVELPETRAGQLALDAIERAVADDLQGDVHLTVTSFAVGGGSAWYVTGAYYVDSEGVRS